MAYPESVLLGAGSVLMHHRDWDYDYEFPHPTAIDLTFRPERYDGGATIKTVIMWGAGGKISKMINRQDGWRPILTLTWNRLSADATDVLRAFISKCNLSAYPIVIYPHADVQIRFNMLYDTSSEVDYGSPGGMYLGHAPTVRFIGVDLLSELPNARGSGGSLADEMYPLIF